MRNQLNSPLDQFADRIKHGEVAIFIKGLMEKGVTKETILTAVEEFEQEKAAEKAVEKYPYGYDV